MLLFQILKHLPDDPQNAMKVDELVRLTALTTCRCRSLLDRAVNGQYVTRIGYGTKGSAWTYHLTDSGKDVVTAHKGVALVSS